MRGRRECKSFMLTVISESEWPRRKKKKSFSATVHAYIRRGGKKVLEFFKRRGKNKLRPLLKTALMSVANACPSIPRGPEGTSETLDVIKSLARRRTIAIRIIASRDELINGLKRKVFFRRYRV